MSTLPLTLETLQTEIAGNETSPLMSPQCVKAAAVLADSSSNASNEMDETPERPTKLILDSSQNQQQHSNITPLSATTTPHGNISPALSSAGSLSPSFLPEMPQWKRDLIQRRKQNVQRTISASSPTSSPTTTAAAAAGGGLKTSTSSSSVRSLAGSNTNIDQLASDGYLPQNCSTKDFTKTKLKPASVTITTPTTTTTSPLKEKTEKLFGGQYTATTTTTQLLLLTKEEEIITNTQHQQQQQQQNVITCKEEEHEHEQSAGLTGSIHNINSLHFNVNMSEHLKRATDCNMGELKDNENVYSGSSSSISSHLSDYKHGVKQCLNKCESERLQGAVNLINLTGNNLINNTITNKTIGVNSNNQLNNSNNNNSVNVINKISQKLQENQFIKNEQHLNTKKFIKYKQNTLDLKSPTKSLSQRTILTTSTSATCLATSALAATSSATAFSASSSLATAANVGLNQKKMVAVQEMKKSQQTTTKTNHHHHLTTITNSCQANNRIMNNRTIVAGVVAGGVGGGGGGIVPADLDNPEDLSYGPGIVSKLRCRYLSLALRESMEQQRLNKDQLRRSTSLNNLLDNCEQDEEEEEEEEEDEEYVEEDIELAEDYQDLETTNIENIKPKIGILKSSLPNNNANAKRFTKPKQSSHNVGVTFTETSYNQRSRHLKRGNDSLKRARSVEALLSEKSTWFSRNNSTNLTPNNTVTIEDKIQMARERLQQGSEHMPPKRLTSIIDDTERPPPDLVKQTLKMFEASAKRRPRNQMNNKVKGEVASKVETFKNIIKEQKPSINYPKPLSPSKKLNTPLKVMKSVTTTPTTPTTNDLMQTPPARKTLLNSECKVNKLNNLSEHTPDIIPRNKLYTNTILNNKKECKQREFPHKEHFEMVVDSPITALSKELSKMSINNDDNEMSNKQKHKQSESVSVSEGREIEMKRKEREEGKGEAKEAGKGEAAEDNETKDNVGSGDACQQQVFNTNNTNTTKVNKATSAAANTTTTSAASATTNAAAANLAFKTENAREVTAKNQQEIETKFNNYDSLIKTSNINTTAINSTPPTTPTTTTTATKSVTTLRELEKIKSEKVSNDDNDRDDNDDDENDDDNLTSKRITRKALDNIAKAGYTQQFKFNNSPTTTTTPHNTSSPLNSGKQIGVIKPLLQQPPANLAAVTATSTPQKSLEMDIVKHNSSSSSASPSLTSREIEKNRINDLKKSNSNSSSNSSCTSNTSSLNVVNTTTTNSSPQTNNAAAAAAYSEVDTVISATNSPLWAMRKRRQTPPAAPAENTSMVFNFSNRKEVPDYIENDGVIFRRKRELPKPNESGFVLLGDLSVETSTDMDYDDFSMCPPSPCDVEFVNANIVIDGKSSIRQKSKDTTFRVQFNDTLTSTFEYPSEASLIVDDSFSSYNDGYTQPHDSDDFTQTFQNLCLESSAGAHHHVADEIIQLPPTLNTTTPAANVAAAVASNNTPTKNILGNLPLGSAPLGFYTPLKAPIDRLFQLGVTRAPSLMNNLDSPTTETATSNGINRLYNGISSLGKNHDDDGDGGNGSIVGISGGLISDDYEDNNKKSLLKATNDDDEEEAESLQYIKPAEDDLNIAYSEGTQKTDLLY